MAPLAAFHGLEPPAPAWFEKALAHAPERTFIEVEGARVETLAWGQRGKPGLMLLHGGAAGAFDAGAPVVVGHSFGGRAAMGLARDFGDELLGAVMVDPPFFASQNQRPRSPPRPARTRRVQPSLSEIVARFRLQPAQRCDNPFILDFIARRSAHEVLDAHGKPGWSLCFDPHFWEKFTWVDGAPILAAARCPMALIRGAKSQLLQAVDADYLMSFIPGSPDVVIPEAEHHVMIDQPLAFVAALRALLAAWPAAKAE